MGFWEYYLDGWRGPFVIVMNGGCPFMVFGVCGIVGGILLFFLTKTLNKPLYDTMNGSMDEENRDTITNQ